MRALPPTPHRNRQIITGVGVRKYSARNPTGYRSSMGPLLIRYRLAFHNRLNSGHSIKLWPQYRSPQYLISSIGAGFGWISYLYRGQVPLGGGTVIVYNPNRISGFSYCKLASVLRPDEGGMDHVCKIPFINRLFLG